MGLKYFLTLFFLLCQALGGNLLAQVRPHLIKKITVEEGLSSNTINDIIQDDDGFLWIATSNGLNRFDGTEIVQYYQRDSSNSIADNYTYCLKKLPGKKIAIGTKNGLSFYDCQTGRFTNFYYGGHNALDEFNNVIIALETDAHDNLWAVSRNCVFIFDKKLKLSQVIFSRFTEADATRQRLRFVEKVLPLSDGNVLMYSRDGWSVYTAKTKKITGLEQTSYSQQFASLKEMALAPFQKKTFDYFPGSNVFKIFGNYFLCVKPLKDSLFLINEKGEQTGSCFFSFNKYPFISWSQQLKVMDSTKLLFLFHGYGVSEVSVNWQQRKPSLIASSPLLFESNEYCSALTDRQGNWWLATIGDGLQKVSPERESFKHFTLMDISSRLPVKYEVNAIERYQDKLWAATYGDGFFRIDLLSGKQEQFLFNTNARDPWPNFIWNVRQTSRDTVWVGTQAGMFWYCISNKRYGRLPNYPGKPMLLDSVPITTQFADSHGLVWMGLGKGNGVCYFDGNNRSFTHVRSNDVQAYPLRYPTHITEDRKGNLWFTNDASTALVYWNRDANYFKLVSLPAALQKKISPLSGLWCESDSSLWLGTVTSGLIKFNPAAGVIKLYGHDKGLADIHVSAIYEDHEKRLWLATNGALSCFDQVTQIFSNYMTKDGLPVKYPTAFFFYDSIDKCLYNGGQGGLFCFDPMKMTRPHVPDKTIITTMEVNGKPFMFRDETARFSPSQNDIAIHYTAVDLTRGPEIKYEYRLIGVDTGWMMAGSQRQINFSHLGPGDYTFMVRAVSNSGMQRTMPDTIHFLIKKPFTQTVWFYLLLLLVMAGIFYVMYRFRLRQMAGTERMRSEISRNLHDEVGSVLTNISLGSLLAQKQVNNESSVSRLLERIYQDSQSVSESLREIVWSINPRIDTLGEAFPRMLRYASELLEAKGIELQADVAPGIDEVKLDMQKRRDLYLIFKEAINNLARHSNATIVKVNFRVVDNLLLMVISDNGVGFDTNVPLINNGLRNMQDRASSHKWDLQVRSMPGAGATVTLLAQIA